MFCVSLWCVVAQATVPISVWFWWDGRYKGESVVQPGESVSSDDDAATAAARYRYNTTQRTAPHDRQCHEAAWQAHRVQATQQPASRGSLRHAAAGVAGLPCQAADGSACICFCACAFVRVCARVCLQTKFNTN
eukprot:COSAG06_NODE_19968_length_815_cov_1.212291_1_plen_133_part_01